jgi:hypothetical protein
MDDPKQDKPAVDPNQHPAVRDYTLLGVGALLVMALMLAQSGLGWWSALPAVVGTVTLLVHWNIGPPLVLLLLVVLTLARVQMSHRHFRQVVDEALLGDLMLAIAGVVYLASSQRLQALVKHLLPPEARRESRPHLARRAGRRWLLGGLSRTRNPDTVRFEEIIGLLVGAFLCGALALLFWLGLQSNLADPPFRLDRRVWQAMMVIWLGGVGVLVLSGVRGYLSWLQATRAEAMLYLQDQAWRETRREEGHIQRWLVWARLRRERRMR